MMFPKTKYRSTKSLRSTLDRVFSEYIRLRDSDEKGYCHCITCGKVFFWKEIDAGHFISRDKLNTRYDENNVHAQCKACNRFHAGEQFSHGQAMDRKYGDGTANQLKILSQMRVKLDDLWYQYHIKFYREQVKDLKKVKGL